MTLRKLTAAAALTIAAGLALPASAEAGHRHGRGCGHRYSGSNYYRNDYRSGYGYAPGYSYNRHGYGGYGGGYRYYRPHGYYRSYRPYGYYSYPPPVYRYGSRPHVSIHLDF